VLECGFYRASDAANPTTAKLPLLTTVEQIKSLKREEAMRGYPVKVRGVVTWADRKAVVIQDSSLGIFVDEVEASDSYPLRVGEFWEIEGITVAQFSPMILSRRAVRLGAGKLPSPVRPARDQLLNGTLDTQYVELQGVVTDVHTNQMSLLTREGKILVHLPDLRPEALTPYAGALVRVRGCLWAVKDETTHVFKVGEVQIHSALINVDQPAPMDPFAAPLKRAAELLLFDAQAGAFQPVRVTGQLLHEQAGEYFLMDGTNGLRFIPKTLVPLQPGDKVEVVGFPELSGPSPVLLEATARKLGQAPLPEARTLSEERLVTGEYDSTRVQLKAYLVNLSTERRDQVFTLQLGSHFLVARLSDRLGTEPPIPLGSLLELTGVYAAHGGDRMMGRVIDSFELLLNSPADIRVLARPSWWTLRRLLAIVGVLAAVLVVAAVWIGLLRRQVEQRTVQLREEIQVRERAEHQRAVEEERSRIARDLHDDLGSSLTEISLLADAGGGFPPTLERAGGRFRSIADKARALVNALDVIVWLVNPCKDALPFLVGYLGSYAEEFLSASGISCRLRIPMDLPPLPLSADVRHSLFLAVKEALNNIARHSRATEVVVEMTLKEGILGIILTDNGRGFDAAHPAQGNGLSNLQERLAGMGGRCEISSRPQSGTIIALSVRLPATKKSL
jgi:signal transduction histidine kinase